MDANTILMLVLSGAFGGSLIVWLFSRTKAKLLEGELNVRKQEMQNLQAQMLSAKQEHDTLAKAYQAGEKEKSVLEERLHQFSDKIKDAEHNREEMKREFERLAEKVLETKSIKFDQQHRKGISDILQPLKERIESFEKKVERNTNESIERHSSLKEQIVHLSDLNNKMSKETLNLTKALKGDTKKQGNWGELILESILDKSGLEKDREYFVQEYLRDDMGKSKKPDVVIALPDNKKIIIDSKVSLTAYDSYMAAVSEEELMSAAKAHLLSVTKHIDELAGKNYEALYQLESPDFVLMFIPIDPAFALALEYKRDLYNYAYDKQIVIVTPATLLATLKTVESLWRNEKQYQNSIEIATEAGKMYDKFVGFIEDMDKLGNQLNTVQNTYDSSMKKLSTGSGNLVSRGEKMKKLGAKASKSVDVQKLNRS
jgi:DNA recombination protein RmuC